MGILRESYKAMVEFAIARTFSYQCEWMVLGTYKDVAVTLELILLNGAKATAIAYFLPQAMEEHARVCQTIAHLPTSLPHQLLILVSLVTRIGAARSMHGPYFQGFLRGRSEAICLR
jgi:hypothetical protein